MRVSSPLGCGIGGGGGWYLGLQWIFLVYLVGSFADSSWGR